MEKRSLSQHLAILAAVGGFSHIGVRPHIQHTLPRIGPQGSFNKDGEAHRRLEQQLRVARNRMRRYGKSQRGRYFMPNMKSTTPHHWLRTRLFPSDFHIEIRRLLTALGRHDEAAAMEARRKGIAQ